MAGDIDYPEFTQYAQSDSARLMGLISSSTRCMVSALSEAMLGMHNEIIASLKLGLGWSFSRSVCTRLREYGRVVDAQHRLTDRTLSSPPPSALLTQE